jgi:hypothetical protein
VSSLWRDASPFGCKHDYADVRGGTTHAILLTDGVSGTG